VYQSLALCLFFLDGCENTQKSEYVETCGAEVRMIVSGYVTFY